MAADSNDSGPGSTAALRDAVAEHRAGRVQEALRAYEAILGAEPANARALALAGTAHAQLGNVARGIALLREAIAIDPDDPESLANLGKLLRDQGYHQEASAILQRLLEIVPDYAEGHVDVGMVLRQLGRYEESGAAYQRALQLDPDSAEAHANLGNVLQDQDRIDEAIPCYERAIELAPDLASVHRALANALHRKRELDRSIISYRRAVELAPRYVSAVSELGSALVERGDHDEGILWLRRAIELAPGSAKAYANLGVALLGGGDARAALEALDRSLEHEPGNSHALAYKTIALHDLGMQDALARLVDFDALVVSTTLTAPAGFGDLVEYNAALVDYACNHASLKVVRREGITSELLQDSAAPIVAFRQLLHDAVDEYIDRLPQGHSHPFLARTPRRYRLGGWANVLNRIAEAHIHPHAWLSGAYYAKSLGAVDARGEGQAGWLEVGRPDPDLYDASDYDVRVFEPLEGRLVMFPSFMWHRILPFESVEQRVSYAFDVIPEL